MANTETIYTPEKKKEPISLTSEQKNSVRNITLGIEEVDENIRSMAQEDVVQTLENGHPLNRIITDTKGEMIGYIACEDFVPHEAYIKYLGTNKQAGRNLFTEIPAFLEYAKNQGYTKLNFHGWNDRLNHVLERYGFKRIKTDSMGGFSVDFYEKVLVEQKSSEEIEKERANAFEIKYIKRVTEEYQKTLLTFGGEVRPLKERLITEYFQNLSMRLQSQTDFKFSDRQKIILKLKLARHLQNNETCDSNTLFDAVIESPKFLDTDKGSFYRLFEVHEEKTLQKIAEIRKQRALITGKESLNPYENLFETKSGKYYVARLLNMPHLEEESEYMKHCIGTSDSYINRIKRGEVEILSFRQVPKINPKTQKLEQDIPIITIEYNLKTKVIEQIKKSNNEYISTNDPFFSDVVDALSKLRGTKTDTGELRDFKKIAPSELENILVKDYHVLTERGEVAISEFNPDDFVLKIGTIEDVDKVSNLDAVKVIQATSGLKILPEQIARNLAQININTKMYLGKLEPSMFVKLPDHVEHICISLPEVGIRRSSLEIGGKTKEELKKELRENGIKTSPEVEYMIDSPDFITLENKENIKLVRLKIKDLGFTESANTDQIYDKARELGLELCPPEVGLYQRLKDKDQPFNEWYRIAMKQIAGRGGYLGVFNLGRRGGGLWLNDDWADPRDKLDPETEFVFRLAS